MLYNEDGNIDYINMFLKRIATEDELNVITSFWKEILPYRYFKSFYKKIPKKFFFSNADVKKVKICGHRLIVKSSSLCHREKTSREIKGDILKTIASHGVRPAAVELSMNIDNKEVFEDIYNYSKESFVPITGFDTFCENDKKTDIFSLGLIKKRKVKKTKIKNGLNLVVIGEFTDVNNPMHFNAQMQKRLSDACFEILKKKLAKACQTCEAGVFTSMVKLLQNKNWGVFVSVDNLHKTSNDFQAWQYLTSKDPERLIFGVKNRKLVSFINILDKYEIPFSIIGKVDKSKHFRVMHKGRLVIDIPKKLLFKPVLKINNFDFQLPQQNIYLPKTDNFEENFNKIIDSKQFKNHSFKAFCESNLGWQTSLQYCDTTELFFPKAKHYISSTINSNPLQIEKNPYSAGKNLVCDAARRLVCLGHKPVAVSVICSVNFSKNGEVRRFDEVKNGILHSAKRLKMKILNVNVVDTLDESTYCVNVTGKRNTKKERFLPYFDKEKEEKIYVIGKPDNLPSTSYYQKTVEDSVFPYPDEVNMRFEKRLYKCIEFLQENSLITSSISVDKFGIFAALIKALKPNKKGFLWTNFKSDLQYLFNENESRVVISTNAKKDEIEQILTKHKVPFEVLGETNNSGMIEIGTIKRNLEDM